MQDINQLIASNCSGTLCVSINQQTDLGFYPIIYLDKEYKKDSGFQELGFIYKVSENKTKLNDYIADSLINQKLERVQFNKDIILCFLVKEGKHSAQKKQGVIVAESKGVKIITDKNKGIETINTNTLEYRTSYSRMDYGERILIKFTSKDMLDVAYVKFYFMGKLCGKIQLERTTKKAYYSVSMMTETNYRSGMFKSYTKEKINMDNSTGLGFDINDLAKSLIKKSIKKPDENNYVAQEQIYFLALFSHGIEGRIFGDGKSINKDDIKKLKKYIYNGSLLFSKKCIIFLGACNAGTGLKDSFAQELANITHSNVYAMVGDGVAPVGNESREQMKYGPKMGNAYNGKFYKFMKSKDPIEVGKYIDILKLINEAK